MPLRALFFDAAGTLIHPAESVGAVYARHAAGFGVKTTGQAMDAAFRSAWKSTPPPLHPPGQPPADDDRSWWLKVASKSFAAALGHALDDEVMLPLFDGLYAHYAKPEAWSVYDDVRPALETLHGSHELLALSNFDRRLLSIFDGHDLSRFFTRIILSSEVGASKPHSRMFEAALNACGADAADCLHVGDDPRCDADGAQLAGLRFFAVKRPESGLDTLVEKVRQGAFSGLRSPLP
ncbi:MAG: HAD-IA family hydrolase [Verrucomicrobiaceae bacterium]|nr:HAD-IA family hydrolase [Verrucomicrobiaceae bacterium]